MDSLNLVAAAVLARKIGYEPPVGPVFVAPSVLFAIACVCREDFAPLEAALHAERDRNLRCGTFARGYRSISSD